MVETVAQRFVDALVHPIFVLPVAVVPEIAVGFGVREKLFDAFPDLFQTGPGDRRAGIDLGPPSRFGHGKEPQGSLELGLGQFGLVDVFAVGLGDDHDVGHLHDAAFDALQFVARAGDLQQHEHVHHRVHGRLGLADAHGLDEDHVESGRFAQHDRLARFAGDAAQRARRRRGADEDIGIGRDALHAGLVAEDRAAAPLRRGVDGQYGELVPQRRNHVADGFDEGRFARARDARDADADRSARMGQTAFDDLLRLLIVVGIAALDERDGLRENGDVAPEDACDILLGGETSSFRFAEVRIDDGLVGDAFGYVERAVVMGVDILFFVVVDFGERHGYSAIFSIKAGVSCREFPIHKARFLASVSTPNGR